MKIMTLKSLNKIILFVIISACTITAQEFKKTSTAGFVFLQLPVTARSAALGEASISLPDLNSDAIFINPASAGNMTNSHSFSASYSPWIADIKHYVASYSYKSTIGVFSAGVLLLDYGTMQHTEIPTSQSQGLYTVLGTFQARSLAAGISYSKMLTDRFSFGAAVKYVQEKIYIYDASNVLFDGGVIYNTGFNSLRIAATFQNFGVETKFINDVFKMPTVLKLGMSGEIIGDLNSEYRLTLCAEAIHPNDGNERVNIGSEFCWKDMVFLRGGYKFFYDEESYSVGLGIKNGIYLPLNLDFAYADYGRLGDVLRLTINIGIL